VSRRASPHLPLVAALAALAALALDCSGPRPAPRVPLLPPLAAWKTLLGDSVVAPLATDGRRVFVATRDGSVRALEGATGAELWRVEGHPGRLSASDGVLLVRGEAGEVASLHPRTGTLRWRTATGVGGALPVLLDRDHALVAGRGTASLALETGALAWSSAEGAEASAPPAASSKLVLLGDRDGLLRALDRDSGRPHWSLQTREALAAPPLVDEARGRLYLATTDKRIVELSLERGRSGWSVRIGADAAFAGLLQPDRVIFAPHDAVLYALARGGNLAWRRALPSRPAGPPLEVDGHLVVACLENQVAAFEARSGTPAGGFKTPAEIRTPPILAGGLLVLGLRDRSVIAYALGAAKGPLAPTEAPVEPPLPGR
jgi:outer membrane protein assembly factor BamB